MTIIKKQIIAFSLIFALLCTMFSVSVNATAREDVLSPYRIILEELNTQLGTDYIFPTASQMEANGETYSDLVDFYTNMSIDEFKNYVISAYNNEMSENKTELTDAIENESEISMQSYSKKQKYYYDTTGKNYLFITSTVYTADSEERYSSINSYGCYKRYISMLRAK